MPRSADELQKIETDIEETRNCLNEMVSRNMDNIVNPEVIRLSQSLDRLLNLYMEVRKRTK